MKLKKKNREPVSVGEIVDHINKLYHVLRHNTIILNCFMDKMGVPQDFIADVNEPVEDFEKILEKFKKLSVQESLKL